MDIAEIKSNGVKPNVLGTFEGECADANITNLNGLDITYQVWENVFNSDDYKKAIQFGWYLGFLGHPDDPNCMDFEHACIVMTEGHIDPSGKVYGKFNLLDTPVGRIVKSFIDAGVTFGISVRGAGDIVDNSVDPNTFVFRGFDIVTFPAYPDSIPKFSTVAASSDTKQQVKYRKVCAALSDNLEYINSCSSLDIIQSQFAKQSEEYAEIEARKCEILGDDNYDTDYIQNKKIECMVNLYLEEVKTNEHISSELISCKQQLADAVSESRRKIAAIRRITSAQNAQYEEKIRSAELSRLSAITATNKLKKEINKLDELNLKYKQKVESSNSVIRESNQTISDLRSKLHETVIASETNKSASNLDVKIKSLKSRISECEDIIREYQQAYGNLLANAVGIHLENLSVTASTSVDELKNMIYGGTSTANVSTTLLEPQPEDVADIEDYDVDTDDMITL